MKSANGNHNSTNGIPFLDLVTPHRELEAELVAVFKAALDTAGFIGGPMVESFERSFAQYCGARHCVGVGSGTDALRFALIAAGVSPGDVVITVPNTFIATGEAISQSGALPEFVDVDERTYNMDPAKLREYLESKCDADPKSGRLISRRSGRPVTAVVPVHLYGQMADMDSIMELAERYQLMVIEDACQAHGAQYFSRKAQCWKAAGTIGRAAAFSFYPGKNLGACGEAGAVTTEDGEIAKKIRMLRDHGQAEKYYHDVEGYNGRLDAIQAGLLERKLKNLDEWNVQRRGCAAIYEKLLAPLADDLVLPYEPSWSRAVYHLYVVRIADREGLRACLAERNIGTAIHYPIPLHLQKAYRQLGYSKGDFPVSEKLAPEILSLPMYPQLRPDQQRKVAEAISELTSKPSRALISASLTKVKTAKQKNKVVVVGLGEVGKPLLDLLSSYYDATGVDISPPTEPIGPVDVLHICYPFDIKDFVGETARYIKLLKPALTIINSTVAVGTTRAVTERTGTAVANSPVRGKHKCMLQELRTYVKFVGALDDVTAQQAARHFESAGVKTRILPSPEATELAKLTETTYFGLLIAWAQEVERYCDQLGVDYDDVVLFHQEIKYLPPVKFFPGVIGGHCVMPNIEILRKLDDSIILGAIRSSNEMKVEREARRAEAAEGIEAVPAAD